MSGYHNSPLEERLSILVEWDESALVDALRITSEEILEVPEFRHRAEKWIEDNYE